MYRPIRVPQKSKNFENIYNRDLKNSPLGHHTLSTKS